MFFVYGLYDPGDAEQLRYIGVSTHPANRILQHLGEASYIRKTANDLKCRWIRSVWKEGRCPMVRVLEKVQTEERALLLEMLFIREYRKEGHKLTNLTAGGERSSNWRRRERQCRP